MVESSVSSHAWELPLSRLQKRQLDRSIIDYINWNCKLKSNAAEFDDDSRQELNGTLKKVFSIQDDDDELQNPTQQPNDVLLLPKKWNSIVRLQRKILDMEKKQKELTNHIIYLNDIFREYKENSHGSSIPTLNLQNWIPSNSPFGSIMVDSSVSSVRLHPYLSMVFVGTDFGKLYAYDIFNLTLPLAVIQSNIKAITSIDVLKVNDPVTNSESLLVAVVSKDLVLKVYNFENNNFFKLIRSMKGHEHIISGVKIWLNEKKNNIEYNNKILVATCSRDKSVRIWDYENSFVIKTLHLHSDWIRSLDISGDYLLTGSQDSTLRLTHWPTATGLSIAEGHTFPVESVKFIPMIKPIKSTKNNSNIEEEKSYIPFSEEYDTMLGFKYCVSASRDKTIKIWEIPLPKFIGNDKDKPTLNNMSTDFKCILTLRGHESWVRNLKIRGHHLYSCSDDSTIRCWNLHTGECIKELKGFHNGFINCIDIDSINEDSSKSLNRQIMITGGMDSICNILLK